MGARGRVEIAKYLVRSSNSGLQKSVSDAFYSCLNCSACLSVCPVGIDAGKVSVLARKYIVKNGLKAGIAEAIVNTTIKYRSPLAISSDFRRIAREMKMDEHSDTLLYTGQMYSLSAYSSSFSKVEKMLGPKVSDLIGRLIARFPVIMKFASRIIPPRGRNLFTESMKSVGFLLSQEGIQFKLMMDEPYPGTFLLELGYEEEFRKYAAKIASLFRSMGVKRIITTDPHTYNLLKYDYPKYIADFDFQVVFYTDLLNVENFKKEDEKIIFHEPCHLSRGNGSLSSPLTLLRRAYQVILPERSGAMTSCCGGPDELMFPLTGEKISDRRYKELRSLGNEKLVTACPICLSNLRKDELVTDISLVLKESRIKAAPGRNDHQGESV